MVLKIATVSRSASDKRVLLQRFVNLSMTCLQSGCATQRKPAKRRQVDFLLSSLESSTCHRTTLDTIFVLPVNKKYYGSRFQFRLGQFATEPGRLQTRYVTFYKTRRSAPFGRLSARKKKKSGKIWKFLTVRGNEQVLKV